MSQQSTVVNSAVSIDSVFKELQHWRKNKKNYDCHGIPDNIWKSIFQLEAEGRPDKELRRIFGLNSEQYRKKHTQHYQLQTSSRPNVTKAHSINGVTKANNVAPIQFSEAMIDNAGQHSPILPLAQAAQKTKQAISQLKSTDNNPERYLDTSTIIVECIRPDGHRLKIHTTNHRLDVVMRAFFSQEVTLS